MRGIIPATVLNYVEQQLIEKTQNPHARIADYVDFIAGTSTGGILGALYLAPAGKAIQNGATSKYTASEALDFYIKEGYGIFNKSKKSSWFGIRKLFNAVKYDSKILEQVLLREFEDLKLYSLLRPCIITTYNILSKSSFFFNSREPAEKEREFYIRDVLRSTSAAPTYFPPAFIPNLKKSDQNMVNIDGGVFANNPALCAYSECRNSIFEQIAFPKAKDMLVLSIGTGGGGFQLPNVQKSHRWSLINWAKSIPEIMMDGSIDTVSYQMEHIFDTVRENGKSNYKRIDVPKEKRTYSGDMADASPENIEALKHAGMAALQEANKKRKESTL